MKPMRKASLQQDAGWALEVFDRAPYVTVFGVANNRFEEVAELAEIRSAYRPILRSTLT